MGIVKVSFTLPEETFNLLKNEVPKRSRSAFVAKRIEEELRRKRATKIFKETYGILKDKGLEEWKTRASTRKWLRAMGEDSLKKLHGIWGE